MNQVFSTYEQVGASTSSPLKVLLMLYDGSINFLNKAIQYAENEDIKNKNIYANMTREIIGEFNNSLNVEGGGEIAQNLRKLYFFMNRQLLKSNWDNDIKGLQDVGRLLSNLREAWQDVYDQKINIDYHQPQQRAVGLSI